MPPAVAAPAPVPSTAINQSALQAILSSLTPTNLSSVPGASNSPINQFITQMNAANSANAQRGGGILQLLSGQGQAQLAQNKQNYENQVGQINQDAVSRGLNNTTVVPNLVQGATNWLNTANEAVNENTAKDVANAAMSFTQQAPNMSLLSSLLGAGGGGRVSSGTGVNTGGFPGFKQPGSMLDNGGVSTPNPAYPTAQYNGNPGGTNNIPPELAAMNAAYGNPNNAAYDNPSNAAYNVNSSSSTSANPDDYYNAMLGPLSGYTGGGSASSLADLFGVSDFA